MLSIESVDVARSTNVRTDRSRNLYQRVWITHQYLALEELVDIGRKSATIGKASELEERQDRSSIHDVEEIFGTVTSVVISKGGP
jgi:hypothetical protein